jgi:hypothetical protein
MGADKEFHPDYVKERQHAIDVIRDRLKIAQSRQKSYADLKRRTWVMRHGVDVNHRPVGNPKRKV